MSTLIQRVTAKSCSLDQAEINLEWVLCVQEQFELKPSVLESFSNLVGKMTDSLTDITQGKVPPSLAKASAQESKIVATNARLALKQLKMFQRNAQSMQP